MSEQEVKAPEVQQEVNTPEIKVEKQEVNIPEIKIEKQEVIQESEAVVVKPAVYGEVVKCYKLNIRKQPHKGKKNVIRIINCGDTVEVVSNRPFSNDWLKVKLEDGTTGFTMKDYIRVIK